MQIEKRYYTTTALSPRRERTPEGFLVCYDVPMARTGEMMYGPDETPVQSADGISGVRISRDEEDVFHPDTILSMIGKPVTNDHPDENVTPGNWLKHSKGTVLSARRGEGELADMLVGDIMITDAQAIQDVLTGKIEVSAGYDADYEELSPGVGRQKNIFYNHLALVDRGRCGPRCAIGDYLPPELREGDDDMKTKRVIVNDKKTLVARLKGMFAGTTVKDADIEKMIEEETKDDITIGDDPQGAGMGTININLSGAPQGENPIKVADDLEETDPNALDPNGQTKPIDSAIEARFQGVESALQQIAAAVNKLVGAGEQEEEQVEEMVEEAPDNLDQKTVASAKDSAFFQDSYREVVSMAEVILPGVRPPTFDRADKPGKTVSMLCNFRRKVLDAANSQPATMTLISEMLGGKKLDTSEKCMTCSKVRDTFRTLFNLKKMLNNDSRVEYRVPGTGGAVAQSSRIDSLAALNAHNVAKYAKKTA